MAGSTPASLTADAPATAGTAAAAKRQNFSPWQEAWRRFRRHKMALFSAIALAVILFAVLVGPFIWRVPINEIDFAAKLQGPSWNHPLGTDDLGQDLLARLIYGGRISIAVGVAAMVVAIFFGLLVGSVAGMASGRVDAALMWVTDLFLSLPQLPLLLLVIYLFREPVKGVLGVEGGAFVLIVAVIGGTRWMSAARLVRTVEGGAGLVGEFTDTQGTSYVMVVNRDFTTAGHLKLTLRQPTATVLEISNVTGAAIPFEGYVADSGTLDLVLAPGDGRLLRLR